MAIWLTTPLESSKAGGNLVMATVRKDVDKYITNDRFRFRIEVSWNYTPAEKGMPDEPTSELMEQVADHLNAVFAKDPVAVLTGIYTGEGVRDLVFYTLSLHIFQRKFNEALSSFPILPLEFSAEEDPDWDEYRSILTLAEAAEAGE